MFMFVFLINTRIGVNIIYLLTLGTLVITVATRQPIIFIVCVMGESGVGVIKVYIR